MKHDYSAARRHLMKADPKLGAILKRIGRFCALFPPDGRPTPERVMTRTDDQICSVGFSRPKVAFIRDLAAHAQDGRRDLKGLKRQLV